MSDPRENTQAGGVEKPTQARKGKTRRVLLIDPSPALVPAIERCSTEHGSVKVVYAPTIADARALLDKAGKIDLAIVPQPGDGSGLELARELKARDTATATVLLTGNADFDSAQQAIRSGATDVILRPAINEKITPAWLDATAGRIGEALDRQWTDRARSARIRKLKRLCKKLNDARLEVTEQVDVLCNDLVTAYQELAVQMQNMNNTVGYQQAIGEELDLEVVLRKTLEFLLQQAGPCNAAVFLPSSADEFALGGYVNYDCTKESADMLLEHLADVLAPQVAKQQGTLIHSTDNSQLVKQLGDDWNYLADCHMLALSADHDGEALAVLTLFRDNSEPFTESAIDSLVTVAEQMGELLGRIIRVHHRAMPGFDDPASDDNDTFLPLTEWEGYDNKQGLFDDEQDEDENEDGELPF